MIINISKIKICKKPMMETISTIQSKDFNTYTNVFTQENNGNTMSV